MHISVLRNTDFSLPLPPPPPRHQPSGDPGKLRSVWLITGEKKRESGRREGEGGEAASSVSSEIGGARVTKALFLCRDRERRKRKGWRKGRKKDPLNDKTRREDMPATRHYTMKTNKMPLSAGARENSRFSRQISSRAELSLRAPPPSVRS